MSNLEAEREAEERRQELGAPNPDPMGMRPTHYAPISYPKPGETVTLSIPGRSIPRFPGSVPIGPAPLDKWPAVDCGMLPIGNKVIVQYKTVPKVTKSGLLLPDETHDADIRANVTARVVRMGPACFVEWATGRPWPAAPWYEVGDFVRVPLYGGDSWYIGEERGPQPRVRFGLFQDEHVLAIVIDPEEIA